MSTTRQAARLSTAITLLLAFLVLAIAGTPAHPEAPLARVPLTLAAAAHLPGAGALSQPETITTTDQDEQERDQPALSYTQALRLMRTVTPGLVNITTTLPGRHGTAGTGIVLTSSGLVLTNAHVISGAIALSVHDLGNGLDYAARIVGVDRVHDIAVLQLAGAAHLHTARLGGKVTVGTVVASIGNAHGFGAPSLGAGRVVALHQTIASTTGQARPLTGLIEARNGVEPGESGGPMVNTHGHVIGVTVATQLDGEGNPTGHGYAIPIATAIAAVRCILENT